MWSYGRSRSARIYKKIAEAEQIFFVILCSLLSRMPLSNIPSPDDDKSLHEQHEALELCGEVLSGPLKLDHAGLPLIPQPTLSLLDPLNYPNVKQSHCANSHFLI